MYQINLAQSDRTSKVSCVTLLWLLHCLLHRHLTSITSLPMPTKFSVFWQDSHGVTSCPPSSSRCCSSLNSAGYWRIFLRYRYSYMDSVTCSRSSKTFRSGPRKSGWESHTLKFQGYCRVSGTTRPVLGPLPSQIRINDCIPLFMNTLYTF